MDPNEVISQISVDPNTGQHDTGSEPVYQIITTYRDGHTVAQNYKRGSGNVQAGIPDTPDGDPITGVNKTVQATWEKAKPPGGRTEIVEAGRRKGWDPATGNYSVDLGPAVTNTPPQPGKTEGVPNDPSIQVQQPDGTWKTAPNPAYRPPAVAGAGGTIHEAPDGVYVVKPDGTTIKTNIPAKPQPGQSVTAKADDGSTWVITVAPDGNVSTKLAIPATPAGPPVPASATGWKPDFSKPDLGIFDRRTEVAKQLADGVFGDPASAAAQQKANDLLRQDLDFAKTAATNVAGIQAGEAGIYSGAVTQRGQDTVQTDARLTAATSTFNNALGQIASLLPYAKEHSKTAGPALDALLEKAYAFQQKLGGLRDSPQVQPGPYMSRAAAIFQPNQQPGAPMPFAPPSQPNANLSPTSPQPLPNLSPTAPQPPGMTGAPGYVPAPPRPTGQLTIPPPPPLDGQPRDTTGAGYPGAAPATGPSGQPSMAPWTGSQPGDLSPTTDAPTQWQPPQLPPNEVTQLPPALTSLQQQPALGGGDVLSWAQGMGFDPSVLAMFAQSRGQGV